MRHRPMHRLLVVTSLAALAAVGCAGQAKKAFGRQDIDKIRQQTKELEAAFKAHDVQKMMTHYPAAGVLMPPNSSTLRGSDMIQGYYADLFGNGATELVLEARDVSGDGTLAFATGNYRMTTKPPSGGPEMHDRGKYVMVLHNLGGQWKFEYTIWSSDLPVGVQMAGKS